MIRVIVCGAPRFTNQRTVDAALDAVLSKRGPFVLVVERYGVEVTGAALLALLWAASRQVDAEALDPKALSGAHAAVAFPGGEDMAERAETVGVPVWRPRVLPAGAQPYRGPE